MSNPGQVQSPGAIPQSQALSEADPASLNELMSRDPEGLQAQDRAQIIRLLRQDRARREKVAETSGGKVKSGAKATSAPVPVDPDSIGL